MNDDKLFLDYFGMFSLIVVPRRNLGEKFIDSQLTLKILRFVLGSLMRLLMK